MNQDALITEVAKRHGVALGNDDPVMILATLNELLVEENAKAQAAILAKFRTELASTLTTLTREAKAHIQGALRQTLEANRDVLARTAEEEIDKVIARWHPALSRLECVTSRLTFLAWLALVVTLINFALSALTLIQ